MPHSHRRSPRARRTTTIRPATTADAPARRLSLTWLASLASLLALPTVALLLIGFGVVLAVESWSGLPFGSLYESPRN